MTEHTEVPISSNELVFLNRQKFSDPFGPFLTPADPLNAL